MVIKMNTVKQCYGKFSEVSGNGCRHVYTPEGRLLGVITKMEQGGYRVLRMDGKTRQKATLAEAFKSIRRQN